MVMLAYLLRPGKGRPENSKALFSSMRHNLTADHKHLKQPTNW